MPILTELRRATADRVAPFELVKTGIEAPSGGYVGQPLASDRRRVISTDLVSQDTLGQAAEMPPDAYQHEWLYLRSLPAQQRRVPTGGFVGYARADEVAEHYPGAPDQPVAYIDAERSFTSIVGPELELEIHAIPPLRGGRSRGLHAHINHALAVMLREDSVTVAVPAGQQVVDVTSTFPWISSPNLLIEAVETPTTTGQLGYTIPGARLRFDGDRCLLEAAGLVPSVAVRVLRPLGTWIKPYGGAWGESSVGLLDDDDACLGDTNAISLVAAFHVCEEQAQACIVGSGEQAWWAAKARTLAARTPWLRDQGIRRPAGLGQPWPDLVSVDGPLQGRYGPGWR